MNVVRPAMTSVRKFVPRSVNLKKRSKKLSPLPTCRRRAICTANIATGGKLFQRAQRPMNVLFFPKRASRWRPARPILSSSRAGKPRRYRPWESCPGALQWHKHNRHGRALGAPALLLAHVRNSDRATPTILVAPFDRIQPVFPQNAFHTSARSNRQRARTTNTTDQMAVATTELTPVAGIQPRSTR